METETTSNFVNIEINYKEDFFFFFSKELNMKLSKELLQLEDHMFLNKQINEYEYLKYNNIGNIVLA